MSFTGHAGVVSSIVNETRVAVDMHVLDEPQGDDVFMQVGIVNGPQCVEHRGFCQEGHSLDSIATLPPSSSLRPDGQNSPRALSPRSTQKV